METETAQPRGPLGRGNPKRLGTDSVGLYPCPGKVWPVPEFAAAFGSTLETHEEALVLRHTDTLADAALPACVGRCVARSPEFALTDEPALVARRSGGRSAYLPDRRLKFKGCRPVADGATYPLEILPPGARTIVHTTIPFGTLSTEGVMRELLGWAFCREHGLPVHATPVCVYEYGIDARSVGCCLVSETRGEDRLEAHIAYPSCTVQDIIRARQEGLAAIGGTPLGSELTLRGLNLWWYVEEKSRLLCMMHFHGGFRGILNSNIGNDVVLPVAQRSFELCLCDYDTFRVVQIPSFPEQAFLDEFVLRAMIEVVKGSLSICDYVEIPEGRAGGEIVETLGGVYFKKSSLWRAYVRRFELTSKARDWDLNRVRVAFANARRTDAVADVLASSVVNSHYLRRMSGDRTVFYPHN